MPFRVSFFFQQQSSLLGGWSESFWNNLTDLSAVVTKATDLRNDLWSAKGWALVQAPYVRISNIQTFRQVQILTFPPISNANTPALDPDFPTSKLLLKLTSANATVSQWFGGVRDAQISSSGNYVPNGGAVGLMNALYARLANTAEGWALNILDPTRPKVIVVAFDDATGTVTTAPNAWVTNTKVRIQGTKGVPGLNGVWSITVIDTTHFTLNHWVPTGKVLTKSNAFARPQTYTLQPISKAQCTRTTEHKVGKPIRQFTGRRRPVKK